MNSSVDGTQQIEKAIKTGEVVGLILGIALFSLSLYATHLSIKASTMIIKKNQEDIKKKEGMNG